MAKKQLIIDGVTYDLGAESQNIGYTNEDMTGVANAKDALDYLNSRIGDIENPVEPIVAEYSEAAATIIGTRIEDRSIPIQAENYKCTDFIDIPVGVRMFIKTNYAITSTLCIVLVKDKGQNVYSVTKSVTSGGPYTEWTEITIPDYTRHLRFTLPNNTSNHISIKFVEKSSIDGVVKLKVASWNVEGWDEPRSQMTIDQMRKAYREVFDRVNADIICMSEYRRLFDTGNQNSIAENEILCNYPFRKIGDGGSYTYNVIVSKLPIVDVRQYQFQSQTNGVSESTPYGMQRYYKEATIRINGKEIKVISTHCDYQKNDGNHQDQDNTPQFEELIERYANCPYVIIGADFNIHTWDWNGDYVDGSQTDGYNNYKYFTEAGYTLMNFDFLKIPSPLDFGVIGNHTADNIAAKGFVMGKREYVDGTVSTNDEVKGLSDHPMVACELIML